MAAHSTTHEDENFQSGLLDIVRPDCLVPIAIVHRPEKWLSRALHDDKCGSMSSVHLTFEWQLEGLLGFERKLSHYQSTQRNDMDR